MAGDWIKIEHATPDKPEVVTMAASLGIDQDAVVGKLVRLWVWVDQQSRDGHTISVTDVFINRITFCDGFATSLRKVGWLTGEDNKLTIPNFDRHNGKPAKKRAEDAERQRMSRKNRDRCHTETVTREEKRREEKSKEEESSLRSDSCRADSPDAPSKEKKQVARWSAEITEIIEHLNQVAGRAYQTGAESTRTLIAARLTDTKGDVAGIKTMISRQSKRWAGDPKMEEFLRPKTLFTATNFENYYGNRELPVEQFKSRNGYNGNKGTLNENAISRGLLPHEVC